MKKTLIQHGTLVTAAETFQADILIEGERIQLIGRDLQVPDAQQINARGKLIFPGGVDPHVHLALPMFGTVSSDDYYTGGKAAAFGGTTTLIDFIALDHDNLDQSIAVWREKAEPRASVDYGWHMNLTRMNDSIRDQLPSLMDKGITSIKVFTAYNNRLRLWDGQIFEAMRIAAENGLLTLLHAENGDVIEILTQEALAAGHTTPEWHALTRPAWGAVETVLRGIGLAATAGAPLYIVHMNTAGGLHQLRYARDQGLPVMGETCLPYLFFSIDEMRRPDGAKWVCSPPMRSKLDNAALWDGVSDGSIQVMATDHCPFFYDGNQPILYEGEAVMIPGKELGKDDFTKIPNGLPGVGDRMPILWTYGVGEGRITPNEFVSLTSTNPARIFGLYPRKGALLPGSDADLVIWDPEKTLVYGAAAAHHRTDYNLYEGWVLKGFPERVFQRGNMLVDGDRWLGKPGMGRYLERARGEVIS